MCLQSSCHDVLSEWCSFMVGQVRGSMQESTSVIRISIQDYGRSFVSQTDEIKQMAVERDDVCL